MEPASGLAEPIIVPSPEETPEPEALTVDVASDEKVVTPSETVLNEDGLPTIMSFEVDEP